MLKRGQGTIFFTGATASLRGGSGYAAFASAKVGLRAVAQATARELGPRTSMSRIWIIDSGVDTALVRERRVEARGTDALRQSADLLMPPASVAESYWRSISSRAAPGHSNWRSAPSARSGKRARSSRAYGVSSRRASARR